MSFCHVSESDISKMSIRHDSTFNNFATISRHCRLRTIQPSMATSSMKRGALIIYSSGLRLLYKQLLLIYFVCLKGLRCSRYNTIQNVVSAIMGGSDMSLQYDCTTTTGPMTIKLKLCEHHHYFYNKM